MIVRKCNTCGGTYRHRQADGTIYFHACPPSFDYTQTPPVETPRAGARDENLNRVRKPSGPRAEAAGFTPGNLKADGTFQPLGPTQQATGKPGAESE